MVDRLCVSRRADGHITRRVATWGKADGEKRCAPAWEAIQLGGTVALSPSVGGLLQESKDRQPQRPAPDRTSGSEQWIRHAVRLLRVGSSSSVDRTAVAEPASDASQPRQDLERPLRRTRIFEAPFGYGWCTLKPVTGTPIFSLPGSPLLAGTSSSRPRQTADLGVRACGAKVNFLLPTRTHTGGPVAAVRPALKVWPQRSIEPVKDRFPAI